MQFNPHLGDVNNNLTRADRVLGRANPENLDLIVLPEMAFTGYNFKSLSEVHTFLEPTNAGISALWARTTALKYNCHVAVGYPEKADISHKWPTSPEYYNSVAVIGPDGDDVAHHRKAHLYYTDETWALEGDGFYGAHITGLGQTAMGICMDINPYKFQEPWDKFEFAYHVLESDANLVIVSMAWLTLESESEFSTLPQEPDMNTLTYWAMRMEPIIRSETKDEIIFVFANRCGTEGEAVYAGTSAVLGIKDGEVNVYGVLGRGDKKVLIADTNQPPIAKLVLGNQAGSIKRPDTTAPGHRDIPHLDGTAASVSHQRDYEEILAGPRHSSRDQTADWVATQIIPPAQAAGRRDANPEPRNGSQRIASAAAAPADRRGAHEPRAASSHGGSNFTYESSRVGKMAPPKLTIPETTPSRPRQNIDSSAKIGTPIHKSTRTPVRRRSNRNLGHEPLSRPSRLPDSAVVMSAIEPSTTMNALFSPHDSALGRVTPEVVSGRSHRKSSSRKSSKPRDADPRNHRSGTRSQLEKGGLKLNTATAEDDDNTGLTKAKLDARFQDSPVARRPNASLLSYWLETLPANLPQVSDVDPTAEFRAPSVSLAEFELRSAIPARIPSVMSAAPAHAPAPAPAPAPASISIPIHHPHLTTTSAPSHAPSHGPSNVPISVSSMCHQCGQTVPSERGRSRADSQSHFSPNKSGWSEVRDDDVHMRGMSERTPTEGGRASIAEEVVMEEDEEEEEEEVRGRGGGGQQGFLLSSAVYNPTTKRAFALEELPLHIEADVEEPERTPLAKAAFERLRDPEDKAPKEAEPAQLGEEEKVSAVEDEPRDQGIAELESLSSGQPDEITEDVADKEPETEELELDGQEAREEDDAQIPIAVAISGDVDVVPDGEGNHELTAPSPAKDSAPDFTVPELPRVARQDEKVGEFDPMAPRNRIVPPSVKGLEKPVIVVVRPTSVYW